MIEETEDPTTWITQRSDGKIYYENTDGRKWWISGTCIACGECESFPNPFIPGMIIEQVNWRLALDGVLEKWSRILQWNSEPGVANACIEQDFSLRKDIPMTPDGVGTGNCTLFGNWID